MIFQLIDSSGVGGAERHIATLARSLIERGIPTTVILYGDHGANPWFEQLQRDGIPFRVLDNSPAGLWRELAKCRPALLHTHGYKGSILGRATARPLGIPVVTTFHSGERGPMPVGGYELLDEWSSLLSHNIAVSQTIARRLPFRANVIPSFINAGRQPPEGTLPRRIGFVGRFSAEKRPDLFCEIASRFGQSVEWHMYGDGPLRPELESKYGHLVRFHGVVTDMSQVWPTLGALVMPSDFEGLPLAALEALSAGVPVIASRVGDLPHVVKDGETGWLFPVGDCAAAAAHIATLLALDASGQQRMRQACWQHVSANYSERALVPRVLDVYRRAGLSIG